VLQRRCRVNYSTARFVAFPTRGEATTVSASKPVNPLIVPSGARSLVFEHPANPRKSRTRTSARESTTKGEQGERKRTAKCSPRSTLTLNYSQPAWLTMLKLGRLSQRMIAPKATAFRLILPCNFDGDFSLKAFSLRFIRTI